MAAWDNVLGMDIATPSGGWPAFRQKFSPGYWQGQAWKQRMTGGYGGLPITNPARLLPPAAMFRPAAGGIRLPSPKRYYGPAVPGAGHFARLGPTMGSQLTAASHWLFRGGGQHIRTGFADAIRMDFGLSYGGNAGLWKMLGTNTRHGAVKYGAGKLLLGGVPPALLALSVATGYREEGVSGAIKGAGAHLALSGLFGAAIGAVRGGGPLSTMTKPQLLKVAGSRQLMQQILRSSYRMGAGTALGIGALLSAGPVYASYKALTMGNNRMKAARRLELGAPVMDQFGTLATMRARSLQAIQRSSISARNALGMEAQLI